MDNKYLHGNYQIGLNFFTNQQHCCCFDKKPVAGFSSLSETHNIK